MGQLGAQVSEQEIESWWFTDERIDVDEAAEMAGLSKESFYQYRSNGRINVPEYRYGTKKYFKRSELKKAITNRVKRAGIGE